jgi:hypothetical protein
MPAALIPLEKLPFAGKYFAGFPSLFCKSGFVLFMAWEKVTGRSGRRVAAHLDKFRQPRE